MSYPEQLRYTSEHEWVRVDGEIGWVGITEFAQSQLGDVVFVDLPKAGTKVAQGKTFGTIEAVKAVSDLYSPLTGEIAEANAAINDAPDTVNKDPYGKGWLVKIKIANPAEVQNLLDAAAYEKLTH